MNSAIRVIIIEDEEIAAQRLRDMCSGEPGLEVIATCANGAEAIRQIATLEPDLIFVDVELPDMLGIDVIRHVRFAGDIIFCTAHDSYAVTAFELAAIDFLLKPYSQARFQAAIAKVLRHKGKKPNPGKELWQNLADDNAALHRLPVHEGEKIIFLDSADITHFASNNRIVFAYLDQRHYAVNYTLDELEKRLRKQQFFRIHRSTLVNLGWVDSLTPWFGGALKLTLRDREKTQLSVSRAAARRLRENFKW
jgi:DNA-binding LytR/AlgR family response regulator